MATPKSGYFLADGSRVVGTTTVISRFKESGGLLQWAFQQGKAGASSLYEKTEKACDIGTAAHAMVEKCVNGANEQDAIDDTISELRLTEELSEKAKNAFSQFLKWRDQTKLELIGKFQEIQLVCAKYRYGGTPDAIGKINGEYILLDWKTSNKVYADYVIQLAAYKHLIENGKRMGTNDCLGIKVNDCHLLRFSKDFPDFGHHSFGDVSIGWDQFRLYREAYENDRILRERVK